MPARSLTAHLEPYQRIIPALDVSSFGKNEKKRVANLIPHVGPFKIGLQAIFSRTEASTVAIEAYDFITGEGGEVMLDAKFLDILNTMTEAAEAAFRWVPPPRILTFHANVRWLSVVEVLAKAKVVSSTIIPAGVTVLTDHDPEKGEVTEIYNRSVIEIVLSCASRLTEASNITGHSAAIVCSPQELELLGSRHEYDNLVRITPGIRPRGAAKNDQARVMTPEDAIRAGADYLVIGRPIMHTSNPVLAAQAIQEEIAEALV